MLSVNICGEGTLESKDKGLLFNVGSHTKVPTWYGWNNVFPVDPTVRAITSPIIQSRPILLASVSG